MDSPKAKAACCGSAPFKPAPRRPAQEADIIMKKRWTVTLPSGGVKRFQSQNGADEYAEMYDGAVQAPALSPDEQGGEPEDDDTVGITNDGDEL